MSATLRRLVVLALAGSFSLLAQPFPKHTVDIQLDFTGKEIRTTWVNGYLPRFIKSWNGSRPTVWMLDKGGRIVIPETEIWFPDAQHVDVRAVTADPAGNLYASVEVWSKGKDGIGTICKLTQSGDPIRVTRTDDFLAIQIAASPAGEVWGFGLPVYMQTKASTPEDFPTIIRVDAAGRVRGTMLPHSAFESEVMPTLGFGNVGFPRMWATATRVGLYIPRMARWVEFDSGTGALLTNTEVPRPVSPDGKKAAMMEFAMTDPDNGIYAYFYFPDQQDPFKLPPGFYELDRAAKRWVPVRARRRSDEFTGLYGADHGELVLRSGSKTFGWVNPGTLREPGSQ